MTAPHRTFALAIALLALAAAACNGGGDDDATPTPGSPTAAATTSTPAAESTISNIIRELDLQAVPEVQALLADTGGQYVQTNVLYADLTDDGIEEAIVPIGSGGTLGFVGFIVLTPDGDGARALVTEKAGGAGMGIELGDDGRLAQIEPVPGPDDPECCPSMLRRTTYGWNGAALAIVDVTTEPNPMAGVKTPSP